MLDSHFSSSYIRQATPQEASTLSTLAFRSKQFWGYSSEFMEASRPDLTVGSEFIATNPVFLLEDADTIIGFYSLYDKGNKTVELEHFFVAPEKVGQGYGQKLWQHALATARSAGFHKVMIAADPNAEGFYRKMGALRVGEVPSIVAKVLPGRVLPLLEVTL